MLEPPWRFELQTCIRVASGKFTVQSPHLPVFADMGPGSGRNRSLGCSVGCSDSQLGNPDNSEALAER
jgi:hypothetical protein